MAGSFAVGEEGCVIKTLPLRVQVLEWLKDVPSGIFMAILFVLLLMIEMARWIHGLLWPKYKNPGS